MPEPPAGLSGEERSHLEQVEANAAEAATVNEELPAAEESAGAARSAVTEPQEETAGRAQAGLVAALGERPAPSPEIEQLCDDIREAIRSRRPPDEQSLVQSNPTEVAEAAGAQLSSSIEGDTQRVESSYDELDAPPEGAPQQEPQPLEAPPASVATPDVNASSATPDGVPAENVSLDADVAAGQTRMDDAGMSSEPAQLVQSGPVAEARAAQGELAETAQRDPAEVMAEQQAALSHASADMEALQQSALEALTSSRAATVESTTGQQQAMVGSEEQQRAQISAQAQSIFSTAQTQVDGLLQNLVPTAMSRWDSGVTILSTRFESRLSEVEGWIRERHSGGWGVVVSAWDELTGLPGWVIEAYDAAESDFGDGVCDLIREISTEVNGVIATCEALIADARTRIDALFANLPEGLREWAAGEQARFAGELDGLHSRVTEAQTSFNRDLVNRASSSVQEVRERIHALREKAKGMLGRLADAIDRFLEDPAKFILEGLLELVGIPPAAFWALVARIQSVISDIADDPLGFAANLMTALGEGFQGFFDRIGEHLLQGLLDWLFSGLGSVGVTLPRDLSLQSVITFFLQLMGITWPRIRQVLARHIGEENVALIEKAYELIANLIELGPEGLFELIKEQLNPQAILDQVLQMAKDYLIEALITQVSVRIIALFNPVGAIVQAIEAIYRVLSWIFNNAARIFRLVETVVNGIADLVAGNTAGMARAVETALAGLIAPVIDFLADYVGLGDLPETIADHIRAMQEWVLGIIDRVIGWLAERARALLRALGLGGEEEDEEGEGDYDGQIGKSVSFSASGESHRLWIVLEGTNAVAKMASQEKPVAEQLDDYQQMAQSLAEDQQGEALSLIGQARQILTGLDTDADDLSQRVTEPEQAPEQIQAKDDAVESSEERLAAVLAQIQEALGLTPDEIELEKPLSMASESHHLYFKGKKPAVPRVEMATGRRAFLETMTISAMSKEKDGQKRSGVLAPLEEIRNALKDMKWDWPNIQWKGEEFATKRQEYLNALERIANALMGIGAEFQIRSLEFLGHPSIYAEQESDGKTRLKQEYRGRPLRSKFYGSRYRYDTDHTWKEGRLATLRVGAPAGKFRDELTDTFEPIKVPGRDTNVTIDHMSPKVAEHWNDEGNNQVQSERLDFYNDTSNMRLVTWSNNSTDGAKSTTSYQPEVGPNFRGPNDSP